MILSISHWHGPWHFVPPKNNIFLGKYTIVMCVDNLHWPKTNLKCHRFFFLRLYVNSWQF